MSHTEADHVMSLQKAASVLGVDFEADDQAVRAAYVEQIKVHPPDTDPHGFERVRDAYESLRSPQQRAQHMFKIDPAKPLVSLLDEAGGQFRFVGPKPWLEALKERPKS